jgi:hypothetical protein
MRTLHDFYIQVPKSSVRADFPPDGSERIGSNHFSEKPVFRPLAKNIDRLQ